MAQFENLIVWQKATELAVRVDSLADAMRADAASQIRRSSASVPDNIAEGSKRGSAPQFAHFLGIAHGSCTEAQSQLRRAHACGLIDRADFLDLIDLAQQVGWMLDSLRRRVRAG